MLQNQIVVCPYCKSRGKDSTGLLKCTACDGYGEVVPISYPDARRAWPERHFPGLSREGYEPTTMVDVARNRRLMIFFNYNTPKSEDVNGD